MCYYGGMTHLHGYLLFLLFRLPAAFLLDILFGDPRWVPHPVVLFGRMITHLERLYRAVFPKSRWGERLAGAALAATMCVYSFAVPLLVLYVLLYLGLRYNMRALVIAGYALDVFWGWQCLAARSMRDEAEHVYIQVSRSVFEGRAAVSRIVGRDTNMLDRAGVVRACLESVAESTTDGVISPMLCYAAGGAPLALLFKAVSTMDSMVGYRNARYRSFGTVAARLDDFANLVGARLSALCMIVACVPLSVPALFSRWAFRYRPLGAIRVFARDRYRHQSPNSAQTEAVLAGALGVQLAGDAWYEGKLERRPVLGDDARSVETADIQRAVALMYAASVLALLVITVVKALVMIRFYGIAV